jgi:hypothetical protein
MKTLLTYGLTAIAAAAALTASTSPVSAQTACAPRDTVLERLSQKYGETRQSIGLGSNDAVVEVFASAETGSWTITVTMPNGTTCLVASGEAFETLAEVAQPKGKDA